ncbi:MAG: hypothetical protein HRT61_23815 [Ekhidna sp.]|nr:hypothetical protein [Ekhidna sp.]
MKNLITLIVICLILLSCESECGCGYRSMVLDLQVVNMEGDDLLHPETGTITHSSVLVDHLVEGDLVRSRTKPFLVERDGLYGLRIFGNGEKSGIETMYITWPGLDVDTVLVEIEKGSNSTIATKFWYNGELVFDNEADQLDNFPLHKVVK